MTWVILRNFAAPPLLILVASCLVGAPVQAQQKPVPGAASSGNHDGQGDSAHRQSAPRTALSEAAAGTVRTTAQWLVRLRQATHAPAYAGTYVIWSTPGMLASSHIWRASKGDVRVERVDALSGQPRSTYRITNRGGSDIETFLPAQHVLRIDHSNIPGGSGFPNLPDTGHLGVSPTHYYDAWQKGQERVAGFMADVVQLVPRDGLRYGYRVWSEQHTGLAIKLETLDPNGRVLEQAAFSGLTFNTPVNAEMLLHQMHRTHGWRVQRVTRIPTTMTVEGWKMGGSAGQPVPGFALQRCYRQPAAVHAADVQAGNTPVDDPASGDNTGGRNQATHPPWFQCVFSDGLAAVSVFVQPSGAGRHDSHRQQGDVNAALGTTHLLARRIGDAGWVTVVGEVPAQTLQRFAAQVSRLP